MLGLYETVEDSVPVLTTPISFKPEPDALPFTVIPLPPETVSFDADVVVPTSKLPLESILARNALLL